MNGEFQLGRWLVQPRLNAIMTDGRSVRLEPKVMQVLVCLARGGGDVVEKENLIRAVWPDTFVSDDALTRCISELRKTFEDDARESRIIQTIPKIGYRLVVPIQEVARPVAAQVAAPPLVPVNYPDRRDPPIPLPAPEPHLRAPWAMAAAVIVILLAAVLWLHRHSALGSKGSIDSIAVLPFTNGTSDSGIDYLSDGIAMSVSNGLSKIRSLKVISQASTSYYRGQRIHPTLVGEQLGAQGLVTGRMLKKGEDLVIDVELTDARDNSHVWGAEYQHPANKALDLEEEIARDIIAHLQIRPSPAAGSSPQRHTSNNEAYGLYLQGRYLWNLRTPAAIDKSIAYFQQAIAKDPQDALAYAGLADSYNLLSEYNSVPPSEAFPKAEAAALKALSLDESLAQAHTSLAMVKMSYEWDGPGAENEYQRAIALDPNYATAHHWYSLLFETLGRHEEARNEAQKALELDPLSLIINTNLAKLDLHMKKFDEAQKIVQKTLDMYPQSPLSLVTLASFHLEQGNCPAALADFEKLQRFDRQTVDALTGLAQAYARCGEPAKARETAEELEALGRKQYLAPSEIGLVYARLGDRDRTLAWLEKGLAMRDDGVLHAKDEPACAFLRDDPRFRRLLQQIKPLNSAP